MMSPNRGGKQNINPAMSSVVEYNVRKKDDVAESSGEFEDATRKEEKLSHKVVPISRPSPLFPQILVKKTKDVIYYQFITMFNQISINVSLIEALEQIPHCAKFMKEMVTKNRSVNFEDGRNAAL